MKKLISILLVLYTISFTSQTIDATLLELNFSRGSDPKNITSGNNLIFFTADDGVHGRELWAFNKITNLTTQITDIDTGYNDSFSNIQFVVINDILYFIANDGTNDFELWRSDGTRTGTYLIKNINLSNSSNITELIDFNGLLIFNADDGINGQELWKSDGTEAGTILVKDINVGVNGSYSNSFFVFNNNLYFISNDGVHGNELWKSDGTENGTTMVKDINVNSDSFMSGNNNFLVLNNNLYFYSNDGINGNELWKSDGTESGTIMVKDILTGSYSSASKLTGTVSDNYVFFSANDGVNGKELWKSDGTINGTSMVKNINTNGDGIPYFNEQFITHAGKVYFIGEENIYGAELWETDGTEIGTQLLKDINVGINDSHIVALKEFSDYFIFSAYDNVNFQGLWKSDGTSIGTVIIPEIKIVDTYSLKFIEFNNSLFFSTGASTFDKELWITNGESDNTYKFVDIFHKYGSSASSLSRNFIELNNELFFTGRDGIHGNEVYKSSGTIESTKILKDLNVGEYGIFPSYVTPSFTKIGSHIFFKGNDGIHGNELFVTDGSDIGTHLVKDIAIGNDDGLKTVYFMDYNDNLYFNGDDGVNGSSLWKSDGTESGTSIVKNININTIGNPYSTSTFFEKGYVVFNGLLYFTAKDDFNNNSIWQTDGTEINTYNSFTIPSNGNYDSRITIINSNSNYFFFRNDMRNTSYGNDSIWSSDGTQSGTQLLFTSSLVGYQQYGRNIIFNDELYFIENDNGDIKIMKTDGTLNGTVIVKENFTSFEKIRFYSCGNYLYFTTGTDTLTDFAQELWRTDGTDIGTILIDEQEDNNIFRSFVIISNNLFYLKGFNSKKIWYINNESITPDFYYVNVLNSSNFQEYEGIRTLTKLNRNLFFDAYTKISGNELYSTNTNFVLNNTDYETIKNKNIGFTIYPNPTTNNILVYSKNEEYFNKIILYNSFGQLIKVFSFTKTISQNINVENIEKGVYYLKIYSNKKNITSLKLIKI